MHMSTVESGGSQPPRLDMPKHRTSQRFETYRSQRIQSIDVPLSPRSTIDASLDSNRKRKSSRRSDTNKTSSSSSLSLSLSSSATSKPLSILATESPHISVEDPSTFAHRSVETRRKEAEKGGKIKRPLNAFMLYRKSYQNVAKTQSVRNNHQHVSTICGESWSNREPPAVVERFNQLAVIERKMHEQAFPNYRYDPVNIKPRDSLPLAGAAAATVAAGRFQQQRPSTKRRATTKLGTSTSASSTAYMPGGYAGNQNAAAVWAVPGWTMPNHIPLAQPIPAQPMTQAYFDSSQIPMAYGHYGMPQNYMVPPMTQGSFDGQMGTENWPLWDMFPDQFGDTIPDLDLYGGHNEYLRGTEADWEVEDAGLGRIQ